MMKHRIGKSARTLAALAGLGMTIGLLGQAPCAQTAGAAASVMPRPASAASVRADFQIRCFIMRIP